MRLHRWHRVCASPENSQGQHSQLTKCSTSSMEQGVIPKIWRRSCSRCLTMCASVAGMMYAERLWKCMSWRRALSCSLVLVTVGGKY